MKQSFFERLTGKKDPSLNEETEEISVTENDPLFSGWEKSEDVSSEESEGELGIDMYETNDSIVIQAMVAGVSADDLSISLTREMATIKGKREAPKGIEKESYLHQELYWGSFSRTVLLPAEVETEEAEATERHGLLTLKLPKIDKGRVQSIKIRSL